MQRSKCFRYSQLSLEDLYYQLISIIHISKLHQLNLNYQYHLAQAKGKITKMTFKSPQLHLCGKIVHVQDHESSQKSSFYIKVKFIEGQDWKLLEGQNKFETFQAESLNGITPIQHSFSLQYETQNMRGWPKMLAQVWKVDSYGRHNIYGYGNLAIPMGTGHHSLEIPCWRPKGSMYDRFIGANSELQYPGIAISPLNRYGLRTFSGCVIKVDLQIIGRNFQLHGVIRDCKNSKQ